MLEVRKFGEKVELVSDDSHGENLLVEEALAGTPAGDRWSEAEFEDGELVIEIKPAEFGPVGDALAQAESSCWGAAESLDTLAATTKTGGD